MLDKMAGHQLLELHFVQTEGVNPRTSNIETLPSLEVCKLINDEDATVAKAVQACIPTIAASVSPLRKLVACIDGGGTKCAVAVADEHGNIGRGVSGPCNFTDIGVEETIASITLATDRALQHLTHSTRIAYPAVTSHNHRLFSSVLAGIAGFDRPSASTLLLPAISSLFNIPIGSNLHVMNDVDMLAFATHQKHPTRQAMVIMIAGTGSVVCSYEMQDGVPVKTRRAGGWGHIFGDEGSGFDVGKQGIRSVLSVLDHSDLRAPTSKSGLTNSLKPLHIKIIKKLGINIATGEDSSFDLLSQVLQSRGSDLKSKIAGVASIVLDAAGTDEQAAAIAESASRSLVDTLSNLLRNGSIRPAETVLVFAGGMMRNEAFRELIQRRIRDAKVEFGDVAVVTEAALAGVECLIPGINSQKVGVEA